MSTPTNESDFSEDIPPERMTASLSDTAPASPAGGEPLASPQIPPPGTVIDGKYRVEGLLGEGGMGVVLAATHTRLGRKVALKLMRPGVQTDRHALRLVREARAAGRLRSPYVAELVDIEEHTDGTPYLVLERLEGETLAEKLGREGPLPLTGVAVALGQAAMGLATAHAAGVVHRDVKPSNLFLVGSGPTPVVKVLDFGIAKSADPHDVTLTTDAAVLGSPAYMSPEQTRGERDVDARTDVWGLGVTLFEALSGELPFPGGSAQAVAARVAADPPRSLAALRPDLPRAVLRLVQECLEKEPARRCPSALAFLHALAPHGGPAGAALVEEARALDPPRPARPARRRVWPIALGLAAAVAVAVPAMVLGLRAAQHDPPASAGPPPPSPPRAFAPANLRRVTFDEGCEEFPSWAEGGRAMVFNAASGKDTHVFTLDLATGARRALTQGTGWRMAPAVSPRGDAVAYLVMATANNGTELAAIDGSSPRRISASAAVRPAFSPDGAFVWAGNGRTLERVDVRTGAVDRALKAPEGSRVLSLVELADGRVVGRGRSGDNQGGVVLFAAGQERGTWLWRAELEEVVELAPDGAGVLVSKITESQVTELWRVPLDGAAPERVLANGVQATKGLRLAPDGARVAWSSCHTVQQLARTAPGPTPGSLVIQQSPRANDWIDHYPMAIPGTSSLLLLSTRMGKLRPCVIDIEEREPARCLDVGGMEMDEPAPSPDGKQYAFAVAGRGLFAGPLDGSSAAVRVLALSEGETAARPAISPDGRDLYFSHGLPGSEVYIDVVAIAGGTPRRFLQHPASGLTFSPRGDLAVFLVPAKQRLNLPMRLDLATKAERPLAPELPEASYRAVRWSASGARVAVDRGNEEVIEIDVATGRVLRRLDTGNDQIAGLTYVGEELVLGHATWVGDIWMADLP